MWTGVAYALAAGLMWGLVFVGPLLVPDYPAALLSVGRYLAFGLITIPLAWFDRHQLRRLRRVDWLEALKLAAVGNLLYYLFLAAAIQKAGAPLPTMLIGTLPVVISICANWQSHGSASAIPWRSLLPSLSMIVLGILCVNQVEVLKLAHEAQPDYLRYALGAALSLVALASWTWYPLRNAAWLSANPDCHPRVWTTAQGLATLPLALLGYAGLWLWSAGSHSDFAMPFGPRPQIFISLMLAIGLLASWVGTLCWNQASQRVSTNVLGQLIVFETLAALCYAYLLRADLPGWLTIAGILLLVGGVVLALRSQKAAEAHSVAANAGLAE